MTPLLNRDPKSASILLLCTKFHRNSADHYLTNDLAAALARAGAQVTVAVVEWSGDESPREEFVVLPNGVEVLYVQPYMFNLLGSRIELLVKWAMSSLRLAASMRRRFSGREFDLIFLFSPLVTVGGAAIWAKRAFGCRSYAYITDFFPYHHRAIGLIGRWATRIGALAEGFLMRRSEVVGCMSPAGISYLQANYSLRRGQEFPVLNLWANNVPLPPVDRDVARANFNLPLDKYIAVFGGQIAEGRGIEDIIDVARIASERSPELMFFLIGEGRLEPLVRNYINEGRGNLTLCSRVPKDQYLEIAQCCDVGLVATVANSGVPTFPSKSFEYLRAGLPIAASVEATTDYGAFLKELGIGLAVTAGDRDGFLRIILELCRSGDARATAKASQAAALELFGVQNAVQAIMQEARRSATFN